MRQWHAETRLNRKRERTIQHFWCRVYCASAGPRDPVRHLTQCRHRQKLGVNSRETEGVRYGHCYTDSIPATLAWGETSEISQRKDQPRRRSRYPGPTTWRCLLRPHLTTDYFQALRFSVLPAYLNGAVLPPASVSLHFSVSLFMGRSLLQRQSAMRMQGGGLSLAHSSKKSSAP